MGDNARRTGGILPDTPPLERARQEALQRLSPVWLWETDADHRFTFLSDSAAWQRSSNPRAIIGMHRWDTYAPDFDPAAAAAHLADLEAHRPFRNFIYKAALRDGSEGWFRVSGDPLFDAEGRFLGYRGVGEVYTEQAERQRQIGQRERLLAIALAALTDGVALWDAEDRLIVANQAYYDAIFPGLDPEGGVGRTFEALLRQAVAARLLAVDGDPEAFIAERLAQRSQPGEPVEMTLWDGRVVVANELRVEEGMRLSIVDDVTEARLREQSLREAKNQAETANRSKTAFLANVTHELRTPLNAIIGFSEVLLAGYFGGLNPRQRDYLEDITSAAHTLLSSINEILDVSKMEANRLELFETLVDPLAVAREAGRLFHPQFDRAGLTFEMQVAEDSPAIFADGELVRRMLYNLLSNAVKFTPPGGTVTLSGDTAADGYRFSVADTGIGIPERDLKRITEPFRQGANYLTRKHYGTGLGLAIVKGLIERHEGQLLIASTPGKGTTMTLVFPPERVRNI